MSITKDLEGKPIIFKTSTIRQVRERKAWWFGTKLYKTARGAARAQAWGMILHKYPDTNEIKSVSFYVCECTDEHPYTGIEFYNPSACSIHCRKHGYFARLANKLIAAILAISAEVEP